MWEDTPSVEILVSHEHHYQGGDVEDPLHYPLANSVALLLTKLGALFAFIIRLSILPYVQLAQFVVLNSAVLALVLSSPFPRHIHRPRCLPTLVSSVSSPVRRASPGLIDSNVTFIRAHGVHHGSRKPHPILV